jgi:hypothetical protein
VPIVPAKNLTFTVGNTTVKATDAGVDRELGEVDVTNTTSNGNYEFITDISKTTFNFTAVVDSNSIPTFSPGTAGTIAFTMANGRTVTGTGTILRAGHKGGPRGAYTINCSGSYTGAVTES